MKEQPLVSVLMTAYNREKYIAEAIESVLHSTYQNFELLVVDDCSSDNTVQIVRRYQERDNRVRLYQNEKNLGDYPNRNKAASYAEGMYIKYVDSDDMVDSNALTIMVNAMECQPSAAIGIACKIKHKRKEDFEILNPLQSYRSHFYETGIFGMGPSFTIIRKSVFDKEGGFWELRNVSDFEFWLRVAAKYPILKFSRDLVIWREHNSQEFRIAPELYLQYNYKILYERLSSANCPLADEEIEALLNKQRRNTVRQLIKFGILKRRPRQMFQFLRKQNLKITDLVTKVF